MKKGRQFASIEKYLDINQNNGMQKVWKALSDPTRRKILELLRSGELSAGEIAENFETSWPTISHHLDVLRDAGLISSRREGQKILYSLNMTVMEEILSYIAGLIKKEDENEE